MGMPRRGHIGRPGQGGGATDSRVTVLRGHTRPARDSTRADESAPLGYVPPVARLQELLGIDAGAWEAREAVVNTNALVWLLSEVIRLTRRDFDEEAYLSAYPDVAEEVKVGLLPSGFYHYCHFGYFENRNPCYRSIDTAAYRERHADLSEFRTRADRNLLCQHFNHHGYFEDRVADDNMSLELERWLSMTDRDD